MQQIATIRIYNVPSRQSLGGNEVRVLLIPMKGRPKALALLQGVRIEQQTDVSLMGEEG